MSTKLNVPGDGVFRNLTISSRTDITCVQAIRRRAATEAERTAFRHLTFQPNATSETLSFGELDERARRVAARLQDAGAVGERVLLIAEPGFDFISCLFGCLYAGAVAVPAYPPDPFRLGRTIPRLLSMIEDSQARFMIATNLAEHPLRERFAGRAWDAESVSDFLSDKVDFSQQLPDSLALLQYTSGSTGKPRGVMLTQANLMANVRAMEAAYDFDGVKMLHWLPPYHDMGLVGGIFCPSIVGRETIFMSPFSFMQRPLRWLEAISDYRATTTASPNFGYETCLRKIKSDECRHLDLSSLKVAISGAERVRINTLREFAERFGPYGFSIDAFRPSFGLAECTLMVTGKRAEALRTFRTETGSEVVSCGGTVAGTQVLIVDPESCLPLDENEIGEVWVATPSNGLGYWNNQADTQTTFRGRLGCGTDPTNYLRTGDLGFLDAGELFITGRIKDLVIVAGRKFHPEDIERAAVASSPALRIDAAAAFSVEAAATERMVVALELQRPKKFALDEVISNVQRAIFEEFQIANAEVVLLPNGSLPKTSSGKIQRSVARESYLGNRFRPLGTSADADVLDSAVSKAGPEAATETEKALAEIWQQVLGVDRVLRQDSFFALGGNSLAITDMLIRVRDAFETQLAMGDVFDHPTLHDLALHIDSSNATAAGKGAPPRIECGPNPPNPSPSLRLDSPSGAVSEATRPLSFPLSFAQQRFWFLEQLGNGRCKTQNLVSVAINLQGELDLARLERALRTELNRHDVFRTSFVPGTDGQAVQQIGSEIDAKIERLSTGDDEQRAEFLSRPFDFRHPPLLRAGVIAKNGNQFEMLLVVHHLICDEAALRMLVQRWGAEYRQAKGASEGPTITYGQFAAWQCAEFVDDARLEYWRSRLDGANPYLDLPLDFARPTEDIGAMQTCIAIVDQRLQERIKQLASALCATPTMIHLAAFQTLLAERCNTRDVSIGVPVAGRNEPQLRELMGCMINTVVTRNQLVDRESFTDRVRRVREQFVEDLKHADVPFERIVESVQPDRRPGVSPLVQALLVQRQSASIRASQPFGMALSTVEFSVEEAGLAGFDLALIVEESADRSQQIALAFNERLFLSETGDALLADYLTLLDQLTAAPEQSCVDSGAGLDLNAPQLTGDERSQGTATVYQRFSQVAVQFADETAVELSGEDVDLRLTYREMADRVEQFAAALDSENVSAGDRVAVSVRRNADTIAAMLAIWKLGAAYVPIDASYPAARVAAMIDDCEPALWVVDDQTLRMLEVPANLKTLNLDRNSEACSEPGATPNCVSGSIARSQFERIPDGPQHASALAYIMYTSGSTGRPKGVLVPQSAVVNLLQSMADEPGLQAGERMLAHTTVSFDISVLELFLPLTVGATAVVASDGQAKDGAQLRALIERTAPTAIQATPSAFRLLIEAGWRPSSQQRLICGGEALKNDLARILLAHASEVWNVYGPTETTIWSTVYRVPSKIQDTRSGTIPIGRPIDNTLLRICDANGRDVPQTATGELWIGGAGVADGYWKRSDKTDERFIALQKNGPLYYRTGDLVRRRGDDQIEFISRVDNQVKIRGHRIELQEVEAALGLHPAIADVAAVAREDQLVAYVVATAAPAEVTPRELQQFLRARLPQAMVPSSFVIVESLPRTPAGKVDRNSLAANTETNVARTAEFAAAESPTEQALVEIWQALLGIDRVGVCDNFFELGGHSLVAMQLVSRIEQRWSIKLPIRDVFVTGTVRELAQRVDRDHAKVDISSVFDLSDSSQCEAGYIERVPERNHTALSYAEQRMWFSEKVEPAHPFYNMPLAARVRGRFDEIAFASSLTTVIERHEALRTTYYTEESEPRRQIHSASSLNIQPRFHDLTALEPDQRELELQSRMWDASREPFALEIGPLLRCIVYRLDRNEHVILLVMHHIVSDGWSMSVMLRELAEAYRAEVNATDTELQPLPIQYADFANWQRNRLTAVAGTRPEPSAGDRDQIEGDQVRLLDFWRHELNGATTILNLPLDHPRPAVQDFEGRQLCFDLSPEVSAQIRAICSSGQITPFTLLLSTYFCLLARLSGQDDICVGTAAAGRDARQLEELIGFFVNTLVIRQQLGDDPTFQDLLSRVAERSVQAQSHGELPFEKLVEHLVDRRDRSHSPIFQAAFVYQNPLGELPTGPGLSMAPLRVDNGTVKHDLTFEFEEVGERFVGTIHYRTTLFERDTIERFARMFSVMCNAAVADPQCRISRLPALDTAQRNQLLGQFNDNHRDFGAPHTMHGLIEHHVQTRPGELAIIDGDRQFTFAELGAWSDQIAAGMSANGAQRGQHVATYLPRSAELEATMLAIFKLGCRYVPLDTKQPASRCQSILDQCEAVLVVIKESSDAPSPSLRLDAPRVRVSTGFSRPTATVADLTQLGQDRPIVRVEVQPHDVAYTIFTSGSTGEPKGVPIRHESIANFVRAQALFLGVTHRDRIAHSMPPSFDGGLSEVVVALGNGATSVIANDDCVDPKVLGALLREHSVTMAKFTPARLAAMEDVGLEALRIIVTAADTLTGELARKWKTGQRQFFNGYGPTETAVGLCMHEVHPPVATRPPIGTPMANMTAYVLDEHRALLPIGAIGQIYIGGAGVADGYLQRPALSREKFVRDPFKLAGPRGVPSANANSPSGAPTASTNGLMYATGDLGRWNRRGQLEFVGRVDRQVKIRGYRVEPDEVAAQLRQMDGVQSAAVTVTEQQQLVAYVVPEPNTVSSNQADYAEQHVEAWQALFQQARRVAPVALEPEFDIGGWLNSYTGRPLGKEVMREWLDNAVENVLSVAPRRVLEIGCGTGLILFRVAPHVEHYTGTDLLQSSLDQVANIVDRRADLRDKVRLLTASADDLSSLGNETFDTIVINSVVQYFPNVKYLLNVLDSAVDRLSPRGRIVLGDIRSLPHFQSLCAGIELAAAGRDLEPEELKSRVQARVAREEELLVDPSFFQALRQRYENLGDVIVKLKDGADHNELTRYRYEVILRFDTDPRPIKEPLWYVADVSTFKRALTQVSAPTRFTGLLNARVIDEVDKVAGTRRVPSALSSSALASDLPAEGDNTIDPANVSALTHHHELAARVTWSPHNIAGLDIIVWPANQLAPSQANGKHYSLNWDEYCNNPLSDTHVVDLQHELRSELKRRLPDYMIPAAFVFVDSIPQTSRGKVDYRALPDPPAIFIGRRQSDLTPAATATEARLIEIWEALLGVEPIGATDDFFELGGHSMLAVKLMAEIEKQFQREIPMAALFQDATVRHLGALIDGGPSAAASSLVPLAAGGQGSALFCIHPAGGTVFCYKPLAQQFAGERPVYGLQAVGIDGRAEAHTDVDAMAAHYAAAIVDAQPNGPYHLAGWSLGGTLAFEVARQLHADGHEVGVVALLDAAALTDQSQLKEDDFGELIAAMFPAADAVSLEALREMSAEDQLAYFVGLAAQAGLAPAGDIDAARHVFAVFQANVKALHEFRPRAYAGRVHLLRPRDQAQSHALAADPTLGWQALAADVHLHWVDGDHAQMVHDPHVASIVDVLSRYL